MNDKEQLFSMQKLMQRNCKESDSGKYKQMKNMEEMKKQV